MGQVTRSDPSGSLLSNFPPPASVALTPLQKQVDGWVSTFLSEATDLKSLAALTAGSLAYRAGRIGVLSVPVAAGPSFSLRAASYGLGLACEVSSFEFVQRATHPERPALSRWSGPSGIEQGILHSFLIFGSFKGAGRLSQGQNGIVRHLLQDGAMVLSHNALGALGLMPRPQGSPVQQFLEAEVAVLKIETGMLLAHGLVPALPSAEKALALSLSRFSLPPLSPFSGPEGKLAWASAPSGAAESQPFEPHRKVFSGVYLSENTSEGGRGGKTDRMEKLEEAIGEELRETFHETFVEDAFFTVLELPPSLRGHGLEFLKGLLALSGENPSDSHLTLLAAREILIRDPLSTARSGYPEALGQLFLESAVKDSDRGRQGFAFRSFHETLRNGFNSTLLEDLISRFGYGKAQEATPSEVEIYKKVLWVQFQKSENPTHEAADVALALESLGDSRFPIVGLRRLDKVLNRRAHASKLVELAHVPPPRFISLERMVPAGDLNRLAVKIDGGVHTGFVKDRSLAETIVEVFGDVYQYRHRFPGRSAENRTRLVDRTERFFRSGEPLTPELLLDLMEVTGGSFLREGPEAEIVILNDAEFDAIGSSRFPKKIPLGFSDGFAPKGPTIYLRDLSPETVWKGAVFWEAFLQLTARVSAVVREAERLSHGILFDGSHGQLVSEIKARLQEHRWRLSAGLETDWHLADRLGGMVRYLRHQAEDHLGSIDEGSSGERAGSLP